MRVRSWGGLAIFACVIVLVGRTADALAAWRAQPPRLLMAFFEPAVYRTRESGAGVGSAVLGTLGGLLITLAVVVFVLGILHWLRQGSDRPDRPVTT